MKTNDTILTIAEFMILSAKTAPKARGIDNLIFHIVNKDGLNNLADQMIATGEKTSRPHVFKRDADSVRNSSCVLIIGSTYQTLDLDCGFCGLPTCAQAGNSGVTCAYNTGDLGIAIGSAVNTANVFHIDNRIMYTVGYTAIKDSLLPGNTRAAFGIPLSATGKNPFFDRKSS